MEVKHCAVTMSRTNSVVNIFGVRVNVSAVKVSNVEQEVGYFLIHRELKKRHVS